ncbi:MAG TPA: RDD family protein [Cyclobacteriaceae bacterium]|nr:RDD family protein [Cyclobacteriaceae bacterium]
MITLQLFDSAKTLLRKRLFALAIDTGLIFLTTMLIIRLIGKNPIIYYWTFIWTYMIYSILQDAYAGGTFGKRLMGLKILFTDTDTPRILSSAYRNILKLIVFFVGYQTLLTLPRSGFSGYHNKIARTRIVEAHQANQA